MPDSIEPNPLPPTARFTALHEQSHFFRTASDAEIAAMGSRTDSKRLAAFRAAQQPTAGAPSRPAATSGTVAASAAVIPVRAATPPTKQVQMPTAAQIESAQQLTAAEQATVDRFMRRKAADGIWDHARRATASGTLLEAMDRQAAETQEIKKLSGTDAVWARAWAAVDHERRAVAGSQHEQSDATADAGHASQGAPGADGTWARAWANARRDQID